MGRKLKELAVLFIDLKCTQFAGLFHFVVLSIYAWNVSTMPVTTVLFKIGSLHFCYCTISCHIRVIQHTYLPNKLNVAILELKL